jgi:hypothetical protein
VPNVTVRWGISISWTLKGLDAVPLGMTIECIAGHNEANAAKDSMAFHHSNGFPTL